VLDGFGQSPHDGVLAVEGQRAFVCLAGILKGRRQASEAALKYSVYGAGAAGVMLYGISLVAGLLNTAHLPTIAAVLAEKFGGGLAAVPSGDLMVLALGGLLISVAWIQALGRAVPLLVPGRL
jgi:NADH:ubiquinone oxidoreductase subunit 2 (subunit N)